MDLGIADKVAIVAGGSRGCGRGTVEALAKKRDGEKSARVKLAIAYALTAHGKQESLNMDIGARVFMSVYAAKKLALTLSQAIQRYESQFGPVELDIRRRLKQQA